MALIDDHEATIEEIASAPGPHVVQRDVERLQAQVSALINSIPKGDPRPVLACVEHEAIPATAGSMMTHPVFSKPQLDVYRANAALLRAALEGG